MKPFMRFTCCVLAVLMMLCLCACVSSGFDETEPKQTDPTPTQPSAPADPTEMTAPKQTDDPIETTVPEQTASGYVVNVLDDNGDPIVGAVVQLCKDNCYPGATDANGRAVFYLAEDDYKVSFIILPAGYTYSGDAQEFYFEEGSFEMTIVLKAAA